ncbi:MAG TPA: glycosyltransferase [Planctomycetaceae bacterium]|nr:glycosyltransferase [Planctomycetaceae bacterium]
MFAKFWSPGDVKTRLAATVGASVAAEIYRAFVQTLVTRCGATATRRLLAFAPSDQQAAFVELARPSWETAPQHGADLGEKMHNYFAEAFAAGVERAVLIGSDSPNLPPELLDRAFHELATVPVVLGPSDDGGYYLIGATGSVPPVFNGVTWSSPDVWQQTTKLLTDNQIPYAVLPTWYDVDEIQDLRRLQADLANATETALQHLRDRLEALLDGVAP